MLWVVSGVSMSILTVLSTFSACRGSLGVADTGERLGDASGGELARGVIVGVVSGKAGGNVRVVRVGRKVMIGVVVEVQHSQQFSEGSGALRAPVNSAP